MAGGYLSKEQASRNKPSLAQRAVTARGSPPTVHSDSDGAGVWLMPDEADQPIHGTVQARHHDEATGAWVYVIAVPTLSSNG